MVVARNIHHYGHSTHCLRYEGLFPKKGSSGFGSPQLVIGLLGFILEADMAVSINWGSFLGCPYNMDHSILGSILGPLISGASHIKRLFQKGAPRHLLPRPLEASRWSPPILRSSPGRPAYQEHHVV